MQSGYLAVQKQVFQLFPKWMGFRHLIDAHIAPFDMPEYLYENVFRNRCSLNTLKLSQILLWLFQWRSVCNHLPAYFWAKIFNYSTFKMRHQLGVESLKRLNTDVKITIFSFIAGYWTLISAIHNMMLLIKLVPLNSSLEILIILVLSFRKNRPLIWILLI